MTTPAHRDDVEAEVLKECEEDELCALSDEKTPSPLSPSCSQNKGTALFNIVNQNISPPAGYQQTTPPSFKSYAWHSANGGTPIGSKTTTSHLSFRGSEQLKLMTQNLSGENLEVSFHEAEMGIDAMHFRAASIPVDGSPIRRTGSGSKDSPKAQDEDLSLQKGPLYRVASFTAFASRPLYELSSAEGDEVARRHEDKRSLLASTKEFKEMRSKFAHDRVSMLVDRAQHGIFV
jgi:hypothetical protein